MTVPASFLIDGLASAKGPIGADNGIGAAGAGGSAFAAYVAAAQTKPAAGASPVDLDALAIDSLDAALVPAASVPSATALANTAGFIGLVSGGASATPPELTGLAAALGTALQNPASQSGSTGPANLLGLTGVGIDFGDTVSGLAAGARAAASGAAMSAGAADTGSTKLSDALAGGSNAPTKGIFQVLPSSSPQPVSSALPNGAANQTAAAGLAAGKETPPLTAAGGAVAGASAGVSTTIRAPATPIPVSVSKIAQAARPLPHPALAGEVAVAATEATPTAQGYTAITSMVGGAAKSPANGVADAPPGGAGTAAAVIATLIDGRQTGGRGAEALNGAVEQISTVPGGGEIRADGSQPIVQQATLTSTHPADAVIRAGREAPAPQQPPAEQVALQLRNAVKNGVDRISIQLKPATLGTIDIKLDIGHDGRVLAVIATDRADTLDLLQRDARGLERALQDAGLRTDSGSLSFNLRGEGGHAHDRSGTPGGDGANSGHSTTEPDVEATGSAPPPMASNRALDIHI